MRCPIHPDVELRRENDRQTGFCGRCLRHHDLCTSVHNMELCELLKGHEGLHRGPRGSWARGLDFGPEEGADP